MAQQNVATVDSAVPDEFRTIATAFSQTGTTPETLQRFLQDNRATISKLADARCSHMLKTPEQMSHSLNMSMTGAAFMIYAAALRSPDTPIPLGPLLCQADLRMNGYGEVDADSTAGNTGGFIGWLQAAGLSPKALRIGAMPNGKNIYGLSATFE